MTTERVTATGTQVDLAAALARQLGKLRGVSGCQALVRQPGGNWTELGRLGQVSLDGIEAELKAFDPAAGGAVRPLGAGLPGWRGTYSCAGAAADMLVVLQLEDMPPAELQSVLGQAEQRIGWLLVEAERALARTAATVALSAEIGAEVLTDAAGAPGRGVLADQWIARLERAFAPDLVAVCWVDDHVPSLGAISGGGLIQQPGRLRSGIETLAAAAIEARTAQTFTRQDAAAPLADALDLLDVQQALALPVYEGDPCHAAVVMLWTSSEAPVPQGPAADLIGKVLGQALTIQARAHPSLLRRVRNWGFARLSALFGRRALKLKLAALTLTFALILAALTPTTHQPAFNARIEARDRLVIAAPFDGFLAEAPVQLGDSITEGALLIRMDDADLRLEQSRLSAEAAQLDTAVQNARAIRATAEVRNLTAKLQQNAVSMSLVQDQLARATVKAPRNGLIVAGDAAKRVGGRVRLGETLLQVATNDSLAVQAMIDEDWVSDLPPDAKATILLAAWPDRPLPLRLTRITNESENSDGTNTFVAWLDLQAQPEFALMDGMRGIVRVEAGRTTVLARYGRGIGRWFSRTLWRWS